MTPTLQDRNEALAGFVKKHGQRVKRAEAMALLCIPSAAVFAKVVDANPSMRHVLRGEKQPRYLTAVIFDLLPLTSWCATRGEESNDSSLWTTRPATSKRTEPPTSRY